MNIEKLISGGQTGVDRAALDVALSLGIPCGGWCPQGRNAEDGPIPRSYPLQETRSRTYAVRTRWNVRDTDATLILTVGPVTGGTALTERTAREQNKPLCVVDLANRKTTAEVKRVRRWLTDEKIRILNVAGPRLSSQPDIYDRAENFLRQLLTAPSQKMPQARSLARPSTKGATRRSEVPPEVLQQLNRGQKETRTLVEGLAIDFATLVRHTFPRQEFPDPDAVLAQEVPITRRMRLVGEWIARELGRPGATSLSAHPSDTVRGWAAYAIAALPRLSLPQRLKLIRPFADDDHFGVREWAWIAVRPHLASDIDQSLQQLHPWTTDPSPNIRRFAVEAIRPRGVWCVHIPALKEDPSPALPLLSNVKADESRYVQNSVGNWLNDASKTRPDWVRTVCQQWQTASPSAETAYICRRALRSINKT